MLAQNRYFLKVFLLTGLPFGLAMGFDIPSFEAFDFYKFLFFFLFFGFVMGVFAVHTQTSAIEDLGIKEQGINGFSDEMLSVRQYLEISSGQSLNDIYKQLLKSNKFNSISIDEQEELLVIKTGISWISFGEKIIISQIKSENKMFKYSVQSRPLLNLALVDGGRNLKNVLDLKEQLSSAV